VSTCHFLPREFCHVCSCPQIKCTNFILPFKASCYSVKTRVVESTIKCLTPSFRIFQLQPFQNVQLFPCNSSHFKEQVLGTSLFVIFSHALKRVGLAKKWPKMSLENHWCAWQVHCPFSELLLQRNLLICQVTPGSDSGSTSTCPCLWWEGTLPAPAYWPACKFDLMLTILSVLTSVAAHHLLLFNE